MKKESTVSFVLGLVAACFSMSCADVTVNNGGGDTDLDSGPDADADADTDSDTDADSDADSDSDADTDADSDTDSDADTDADSDTDADCDLSVDEAFDGGTLPDGWEIGSFDSDGYAYTWEWSNSDNTTGGAGGHWWVNGAFPVAFDDTFVSATYTPGACSSVVLSFNQDFIKESGSTDEYGYVQIQINDGAWQTIRTLLASTSGPTEVDLSSYLTSSETEFRIRFRYVGNNDQSWKVDDFEIAGTP